MDKLVSPSPPDNGSDGCSKGSNPIGDDLQRAGIPLFDKHSTVLSPKKRAAIAHRKGLCGACGIQTHVLKKLGRKQALSNENVYKGLCIRCNESRVPAKIYQEWKERNPSLVLRKSSRGSEASNNLRSPASRNSDHPQQHHTRDRSRDQLSQSLNSFPTVKLEPQETTMKLQTKKSQDKQAPKEPVSPILLKVFQASPLAYEDYTGKEIAIPFIDLETEETMLKEALDEISMIHVQFETATANSLGTFLSEGNEYLHFSCHGHPRYLFIEDGYGGGQRLLVDENLKGWIRAGGKNLQFVFVSACHSRLAGEAFVDAGVSHVVCCEQDGQALSNTAAMVFSRDFYRAVANGRTLQQAYELAIYAVIHSSELTRKNGVDPQKEAKKFALLPAKGVDHDIPLVSLSTASPSPSKTPQSSPLPIIPKKAKRRSMLPIPPQIFLGREVDLYQVLKALFVKKARLVQISGAWGVGKLSLAKALGHYMEKRSMWGTTLWLPSSRATAVDHQHWSQLFSIIRDEQILAKDLGTNDVYCSTCQLILDHFYERKAVIIINAKELSDEGLMKLGCFLDEVFDRTKNTKVVVVRDANNRDQPIQSRRASGFPCCQTEHSLAPLSFEATARLFVSMCPLSSSNPMLARETLLQKKTDKTLFKLLGEGFPAVTVQMARNMPEDEFNSLMALEDSVHFHDFNCSLRMAEESLSESMAGGFLLQQGRQIPTRGVEALNIDHDKTDDESVEDESEDEGSTLEDQHRKSPPPMRSQDELYTRFAPLLKKEGAIYRKNVTSFIRKASKGEHVVTTIDGVQETEYEVKDDTSWVVCAKAAGEHYVLSQQQFRENYETANGKEIAPDHSFPRAKRLRQQGFREYQSCRKIWARKVKESDMMFFRHGLDEVPNANTGAYFVAPWGESMLVEQGDYLVMQYPAGNNREIYRIECNVFHDSYIDDSVVSEDTSLEGEERSPDLSWMLLSGALAGVVGAGFIAFFLLFPSRGASSRRKV